MPDVEMVEERHSFVSDPADKAAFVATFNEGAAASGFGSRKIIRRSLLGALAVFPLPLVVFLRDLGPMPGTVLRETIWEEGARQTLPSSSLDSPAIALSKLDLPAPFLPIKPTRSPGSS